MARAVKVTYKRRVREYVVIAFRGMKLIREREPDAKHCMVCATPREERTTCFFSYDDNALPVCNFSCYLLSLVSGVQTSKRALEIQRALEYLDHLDREEAKKSQQAEHKKRKLKLVA